MGFLGARMIKATRAEDHRERGLAKRPLFSLVLVKSKILSALSPSSTAGRRDTKHIDSHNRDSDRASQDDLGVTHYLAGYLEGERSMGIQGHACVLSLRERLLSQELLEDALNRTQGGRGRSAVPSDDQ